VRQAKNQASVFVHMTSDSNLCFKRAIMTCTYMVGKRHKEAMAMTGFPIMFSQAF